LQAFRQEPYALCCHGLTKNRKQHVTTPELNESSGLKGDDGSNGSRPGSRRVSLSVLLGGMTAVLTIGFTFIIVEVVGHLATQQIQSDIGDNLKELAFQTTDKLDRGMFERYREVQLMAERLEFTDPGVSRERRRALLESMQRTYPEYAWIGLTNQVGTIETSTGALLEGVNVARRPWYGNANRGMHLTDVHEAVLLAKLLPSTSNEPRRFFDVAFPYADKEGKVAGVLGVHLSWQWAKEIENSVLLPLKAQKKLDAIITDKEGVVLLGPDDMRDVKLPQGSVIAATRGRTGFVVESWPDGKRYLVGYSKSTGYRNYPGFGWTVLVRQDVHEAFAPVYKLQRSLMWGGIAAAIGFSMLVFFVIGRLTRPLKLFARAANDIEAGRARVIPPVVGRFHEIDSLSGSLNSLLDKLVAKEQQQRELNSTLEARVVQRTAELDALVKALQNSERHVRAIIDSALDAFIATDSAGMITEWNPQAETVFGWTRAEVLGKPVGSVVLPPRFRVQHEADMARFHQAAAAPVIARRLEMFAIRRDGEEFPVEMTIGTIETGDSYSVAAFVQDISARKKAEEDLAKERSLLDTVLETIDVGVVACDKRGELSLFNRAAREFHGMPLRASGSSDWASEYNLFASDGVTPLKPDEIPLYRALQGEMVQDAEMMVVPQRHAPRFLLASGKALIDAQGNRAGAVITMKDVTFIKEQQRLLAANEQRLHAITENLPAMIGHIDRDEKFLFLNTAGASLFGRTQDELIGTSVLEAYGAEQYARFKPYIDGALAGRKVVFEDAIEVKGHARHFQCMYMPDKDADGTVNGFYAMAFDITDRKNSELRQAESEERLRTITDNLPVLIAYIDRQEVYRFANATYEAWFGMPVNEMIGKKVVDVIGHRSYEHSKSFLMHNLAGERVRFELETIHKGESRFSEVVGIPDIRNGVVQGAYVMTTDVTAVRNQERQLQSLARQDTLTGLANRRSFQEKLSDAASRAARTRQRMIVMFLDIDHFKQINDSLGHAGGDAVLIEFACRLKSCVRSTDTVARLAGDEFTIILEGTRSAEEGTLVAEKIIRSMQHAFLVEGAPVAVSTSIGIACSPAEQIDIEGLLKEADDALYAAKAAGRNGFHVSGSSLP
jgi:diguanylate cyclase (GGDEF)-like protein/PAS domain S-box-containing protein